MTFKRLPEYTLILHSSDLNITVVGNLPETFSFDVASQYEAPFSQGFRVSDTVNNGLRILGLSLTNQAMTSQIWQGTSEVQFTIPMVLQAVNNEYDDVLKPLKDLLSLALPSVAQEGGLLISPGPRINLEKLAQRGGEGLTSFGQAVVGHSTNLTSGLGDVITGGREGLQSYAQTANRTRSRVDATSAAMSREIDAATENRISLKIGRYMTLDSVVVLSVSTTAHLQPLPNGTPQRTEVQVTFKTFKLPTSNDLDRMFNYDGGKPLEAS